jgi:hypothetical protein
MSRRALAPVDAPCVIRRFYLSALHCSCQCPKFNDSCIPHAGPMLPPPFRPCAGGAMTERLLNASPPLFLLRLAAGHTEEMGAVGWIVGSYSVMLPLG